MPLKVYSVRMAQFAIGVCLTVAAVVSVVVGLVLSEDRGDAAAQAGLLFVIWQAFLIPYMAVWERRRVLRAGPTPEGLILEPRSRTVRSAILSTLYFAALYALFWEADPEFVPGLVIGFTAAGASDSLVAVRWLRNTELSRGKVIVREKFSWRAPRWSLRYWTLPDRENPAETRV
jgi:hypothetical protein